ncbi:MAG TPA: polymer-forming cytoskeletal protein [Gammaproteobacteria bacterium]|jgi:cytoskeletal protein CcmA (bactofilin family)|nr:polymer-forming cytoskeletal protein [Gammaproteobacteria bacterium]
MFDIGKKGAPEKAPEAAGRVEARPESSPRAGSAVREKAVIGPSIHIDGDLRGEEDLLIEGEVNGTVQLRNNSLTIGAQGKVRADVYAHSIYVEGLMEGDLYGTERVHIRKSAQVRGNVTSPRVSLEDGAKFKGSIEMDPQAVQNATANRTARSAQPVKPAVPAKPEGPSALKTGV